MDDSTIERALSVSSHSYSCSDVTIRVTQTNVGRCYLVVVAHKSPSGVLGSQEAVNQHGPAQREVKADVLLKVTAELVAGQVITEAEALTGNQLVYLLSD